MSDIDECSNNYSSSSDSENNLSVPDISSLQPFNFEPELSKEEQELLPETSDSDCSTKNEESRIGNINWCSCGGHCKPMQTYTGSFCCRDTNEIPDELFEGNFYHDFNILPVKYLSTIFIIRNIFLSERLFSVDFFLLIFDFQIFYFIESSALLPFYGMFYRRVL